MGILVNENQIGGGTSNSSHNIGDIFYTTRTDNSLNGAVECNGSQYNFSDFDSNLQALFDEGKLPYVSIGKFDSMVTNQGGCDSFGYGTNDEITLYPLEPYQVDGTAYYSNVYDWDAVEPDPKENYILHGVKIYDKDTHEELVGYYVTNDPVTTGGWYYELYNANNELVREISSPSHNSEESITAPVGDEFQATTYFKVPKKLSRVLVRTQKPTADNNYTWYNVYADGWVEQGGEDSTGKGVKTIALPIEMTTDRYLLISSTVSEAETTGIGVFQKSTTEIQINKPNSRCEWKVEGYADPTEYTKDKWNYQNIQVERCMVQLFNSTTDTAVATCNQVLADVSALNQGDYVIYWDSYEASNHSHAYTGITLEEYQWYRIYKSGWVEQGGFNRTNGSNATRITIPVEMKSVNYTPVIQGRTEENGYMNAQWQVMPVNNTTSSTTTTSFVAQGSITGYNLGFKWQVSGFSFLA